MNPCLSSRCSEMSHYKQEKTELQKSQKADRLIGSNYLIEGTDIQSDNYA